MLVPFIIVVVIAAGLLVLLVMAQRKTTQIIAERDEANRLLGESTADLAKASERLGTAEGKIRALEQRVQESAAHNEQLAGQLDESATMLRKRTELADAQAMQIDALSAARDELQQQLNSAEERIVTLAARPGVVVGELSTEDSNAEMLWDLEVARSERAWRNSVAINPVDDPSPFESCEDPVRTAVEVEASALREDVGAMITVDWKAEVIESPARRLLVLRVAQEMLALAARAPGAARLVVTQNSAEDGELTMEFEAQDDSVQAINLIPPQISSDLIDVSTESGMSITVKAE